MNDVTLKFNLLDSIAKQEVIDFVDFLLSKKNKKPTLPKSSYQQQLLDTSSWDEDSLKLITENNHFKSWEAKGW